MKLGFDIDGVLADFNGSFIQRVIEVTGKDLFPPRPFDIPTWNYPEHYGYTDGHVSGVWQNIKADPTFWLGLAPYPDTAEVLAELNNRFEIGDDIYFITSRPGVDAKLQTEQWLGFNGYDYLPTVLISSAKGLCARALQLDTYIDDRWENVMDVDATREVKNLFLVNQPWNIDQPIPSTVTRVNSALDIFR